MKKQIIILLLVFFFNSVLLMAQQIKLNVERKNDKILQRLPLDTLKADTLIEKFWISAEDIIQYYNNDVKKWNKLSQSKIDNILNTYYKAISYSPILFKRSFEKKYDDWKKIRTGEKSKEIISPGLKIGRIKRLISKKYSESFIDIIGTPYFIKGKIIEIKNDIYISSTKQMKFPRIILTVEIQDIVKGAVEFSSKKQIKINILTIWYDSLKDFYKIGESYFMPVKPWNCSVKNCREYSLYLLKDKQNSIFPINRSDLITSVEYFDFGDRLKWEDFKSKFKAKYLLKGGNK